MKKICFRVDANKVIGQGHAMRCLTLAKKLNGSNQTECCFIVSERQSADFFEDTGFACIILNQEYDDYSANAAIVLQELLNSQKADLVVVDSYFVTDRFMQKIGETVRTACFWCREEKITTDLLINYNINYASDFYEKNYAGGDTRLLLGTIYIPLRQEFKNSRVPDVKAKVESILILTGGSDRQNFIGNFLRQIYHSRKYQDIKFTCMIGRYNEFYRDITDFCATNHMDYVCIRTHTEDIINVMKEQDIVVSAGGTTMYELCALGIPTLLYSIADNQISESVYMQEHGVMYYAGGYQETLFWERLFRMLDELICYPEIRHQISDKMKHVVDGNGAQRIASELLDLFENEG